MNDTWEARFVDKQVDRAWLDLRIRLADRFAAGLAAGAMEPINISTATGERLTVHIDDEQVVILTGDDVHMSGNVDDAAHTIYKVLHNDWHVVHPVFLDTDLVHVPSIDDNPIGAAAVVVPTLGHPESRQQLQAWVEASLQDGMEDRLKVERSGDIAWSSRRDESVVISVRDDWRIEVWTVLGRQVGFKKARKMIDELSSQFLGLKFSLRQDVLIMSHTVLAKPFVADHLTALLRKFTRVSDDLGWVAEEVLRKRVKVERANVEEAEQARTAAETALAAAEERARRAERLAVRLKIKHTRVSRDLKRIQNELKRTQEERYAAQAELAWSSDLKPLCRPMRYETLQARTDRSDAA